MAEANRMLRAGLDARLWAFVPLSTLFAVLGTVLLLTLPTLFAAPGAALPAFLLLSATGLWMAVKAWPFSLPIALVVWAAANWLLRPGGGEERRVAAIAAGFAGLGAVLGFVIWAVRQGDDPGVASGTTLVALLLPGVVVGAVLAALVVYRRTPA